MTVVMVILSVVVEGGRDQRARSNTTLKNERSVSPKVATVHRPVKTERSTHLGRSLALPVVVPKSARVHRATDKAWPDPMF
ncbi:hypothetical protein [Actinopolymorpha pittospori]